MTDFAPHDGNTKAFPRATAWATWIKRNHAVSDGLWLRFFRKHSEVATISYEEALQEALCWGWIDGQVKPFDDESWLQRFTPRRPRSPWSKRNRDRVARLEQEGRMQPSGRAAVEAAKADGRWDRAYDSPSASRVPDDFCQAVAKHKKAAAFFATLNRANLYAISYRLQTAKPETRARRFAAILQMMKDGRAFH